MSSSMKQNSSARSRFREIIAIFVLVGVAVLIFSQRILIVDTIRALSYTPSAGVAAIHKNIELTSDASRMFYASSPELNGTSAFTRECGEIERASVVLGCYAAGKIFLYDVTNDELEGIEEVTAAHEMLHAAYIRLGERERVRVDELLDAEAKKLEKNVAFKERMSVYSKLPNADRTNELHSVIGTEVNEIGSELEDYYGRYFEDRRKIVEYYRGYRSVFEGLQNQAEKLAASLDSQAIQINARVVSYNQDSASLESDIEEFNRRARTQYFQTESEFSIARAELVTRSNILEAQRAEIDRLIDQYNADKKKFDGLASHLAELNNSIDSSIAPTPEGLGE